MGASEEVMFEDAKCHRSLRVVAWLSLALVIVSCNRGVRLEHTDIAGSWRITSSDFSLNATSDRSGGVPEQIQFAPSEEDAKLVNVIIDDGEMIKKMANGNFKLALNSGMTIKGVYEFNQSRMYLYEVNGAGESGFEFRPLARFLVEKGGGDSLCCVFGRFTGGAEVWGRAEADGSMALMPLGD